MLVGGAGVQDRAAVNIMDRRAEMEICYVSVSEIKTGTCEHRKLYSKSTCYLLPTVTSKEASRTQYSNKKCNTTNACSRNPICIG